MHFNLSILSLMLNACAVDETEVIEDTTSTQDALDDQDLIPEEDPCLVDDDAIGMRFAGNVEYPDGTIASQENTEIYVCSGACQTAQWGEGGFCFTEGRLEEGTYSLKVVPYGFDDHATPLSLIQIGSEDIILEDSIFVPEYSNIADVVDGIFDAGNGMEINIVSDNFIPSFSEDQFIAAAPIASDESGLPLDGVEAEKIIGMWYLGPFNADVSTAWSFQVQNTELAEGTTVKIMIASYSERKWLDDGTATVGADGILRSDQDSGIGLMSTLLLVEE
jgi:hypothetical protein